ncbi:hypothetical protein Leryth_021000 [Lithospermum erythrorhizon]|nr:hypothetical protein Leryth_021000 [Lithospermum erythrorhizon]
MDPQKSSLLLSFSPTIIKAVLNAGGVTFSLIKWEEFLGTKPGGNLGVIITPFSFAAATLFTVEERDTNPLEGAILMAPYLRKGLIVNFLVQERDTLETRLN